MTSSRVNTTVENISRFVAKTKNGVSGFWKRRIKSDKVYDSSQANNAFLNTYIIDDLPIFTLWTAEWMIRDPVVKFGLDIRDGAILNGEVEVTGHDPQEVRLATAMWEHLWQNYSHIFLKAKRYGRMPGEVTFKRAVDGEFAGVMFPDQCVGIHPRNTRLILVNGKPGAIRLNSFNSLTNEDVIPMPAAFWITHDKEFSNWYGKSLLMNSYQPFYEKWTPRGAVDTMRKRTYRDAYNGDIFWVPDELVEMSDGTKISYRDMAEAVLEGRSAGSQMVLQKVFDGDGNELTGYSPPMDTGQGEVVFKNYERNQREIWFGLGVLEEVVKASNKGSFSGRSVPLLMFLGTVGKEFSEVVSCIDRDIIRPMVHLWKNGEPSYQIKTKELMESLTTGMQSPLPGESQASVSRFSDEDESFSGVKATVGPRGTKMEEPGVVHMQGSWLAQLKKKSQSGSLKTTKR